MSCQHGREIPVTLNCSGGISLGAYMAGVFTELVKASTASDSIRSSGACPLCIDTITGASAGAMTGLIAAWYLLSPGHLEELVNDQPDANPKEINRFYEAWVRRIDISRLTDYLNPGEGMAALASTIIERIANDLLPVETIDRQPKPLAVIMTVTNLQGYLKAGDQIRNRPESITHAESRRFLFSKRTFDPADGSSGQNLMRKWEKAKVSARMSGAFPVAFPPIPDESNRGSYNLRNINLNEYQNEYQRQPQEVKKICTSVLPDKSNPSVSIPQTFRFHYTDGGVLDGLPILKGIELLSQLKRGDTTKDQDFSRFQRDWNEEEKKEEKRLFVYIRPTPITRVAQDKRLTSHFFSMLQTGISGLTYPKEEHDELRLEQIEGINDQVDRKNKIKEYILSLHLPTAAKQELLHKLDKAIPYRQINLQQINPLTIFNESAPTDETSIPFRKILATLIEDRLGLELPPADRLALEDLKTLIQSDPNNPARDPSKILACDWLGAFGGFFNRSHREHDYLIGRLSALAWMWQRNLIHPTGAETNSDALRASLRPLVLQLEKRYLIPKRRSGAGPATLFYVSLLALFRLPLVLLHDAMTPSFRKPRAWTLMSVIGAFLIGIVIFLNLAGWQLLLGLGALVSVLLMHSPSRRSVLEAMKLPLMLASLITVPILIFILLAKLLLWIPARLWLSLQTDSNDS